jgi:hypothetical protein
MSWMELLANEIRIAYSDKTINDLLSGLRTGADLPFSMHFNQNEEFFLQLMKEYVVPSFTIHHDVRNSVPRVDYIYALKEVLVQLTEQLPSAFAGLSYYFDSSEILKPTFYRLYKVGDDIYAYFLKIDLLFRGQDHESIKPGSNDSTPVYRSARLYIESEFIPLDAVMSEMGKIVALKVRQLISQTWIGETGKGYLVRGIWMDNDLTKFFSKLFFPAGKRLYPFYPFFCKYKTICQMVPDLSAEGKKRALPLLHRALQFLIPEMDRIQRTLKDSSFAETLPTFQEMRARVPKYWGEAWGSVAVTPYLNKNDMKEFKLEF